MYCVQHAPIATALANKAPEPLSRPSRGIKLHHMIGDVLNSQVDEIQAMLRKRLRIRGKTLGQQINRAGRLLPRQVRREAVYLADAQSVVQNPKLARMIDMARLHSAHATVTEFLGTIDPAKRRKDKVLSILGVLAFNLLLIGGAVVAYLWWTGRV